MELIFELLLHFNCKYSKKKNFNDEPIAILHARRKSMILARFFLVLKPYAFYQSQYDDILNTVLEDRNKKREHHCAKCLLECL